MTRIAIPSDDQQTIAQHFGKTAGFLVFHYDGEALTSEYRRIAEAPRAECCGAGGASRHDTIVSTLHDCDVVIAGGMGGGMMSALYDAGIDIALSSVPDARQAAEMLIADILPASTGSGCCTH
jgi:predicted Fe-Mo cluster-binding NifX family protein